MTAICFMFGFGLDVSPVSPVRLLLRSLSFLTWAGLWLMSKKCARFLGFLNPNGKTQWTKMCNNNLVKLRELCLLLNSLGGRGNQFRSEEPGGLPGSNYEVHNSSGPLWLWRIPSASHDGGPHDYICVDLTWTCGVTPWTSILKVLIETKCWLKHIQLNWLRSLVFAGAFWRKGLCVWNGSVGQQWFRHCQLGWKQAVWAVQSRASADQQLPPVWPHLDCAESWLFHPKRTVFQGQCAKGWLTTHPRITCSKVGGNWRDCRQSQWNYCLAQQGI